MAQLLRRFNSLALNKTPNGHGPKRPRCVTFSGLGNVFSPYSSANSLSCIPISCEKPFILGGALGQGAVGTVYKAYDGQDWHAVKVVPKVNFEVCLILS